MKRVLDVLVVEDEPVVRQAARRILAPEGLEVRTAVDVDEATAVLEESRCRLILSDLKLPGASGADLLDLVRVRWPETHVVMITGYATIANALMAFQHGAFDFVPKPFDIGELLGVVRRALRFSGPGKPASIALSSDSPEERCLFLGGHSWARLHADGSATLGAAETFAGLLGALDRIRFPALEERTTQGKPFAWLHAHSEVHRVRAPLSGLVLATNKAVGDSSELIDSDPLGAGWLVHIVPDNLDEELAILVER